MSVLLNNCVASNCHADDGRIVDIPLKEPYVTLPGTNPKSNTVKSISAL